MKTNERVLAYNLSSAIDHDDLQQVSGGGSSIGMTHRQTVRASAASAHDVDAVYDVVADW